MLKLGVYEKPQRLLKIRNPWGSKEWIGKCSERDTDFWNQLSPEEIETLGYTKGKFSLIIR